MGLLLVTPPAEEPLTLIEAKSALRVTHDDEDAHILALIGAARQAAEEAQGRAYVTQTWDLVLDRWPRGILELPKPPLRSVDSITYTDPAGESQTLGSSVYVVDTSGTQGRLSLASGQAWPALLDQPGVVRIRFTAGYGDASEVPETQKQLLHLLIATWYVNREGVVTGTISSALPYAIEWMMGLGRGERPYA